jgi:hypothetical protein
MSNPKSGGTGLRRFYLADFARQTKAWYKGLSFRKGPPPRSSLPPSSFPRGCSSPYKIRQGLALTVPALVAVTVLESTNHFPVTTVPEAVIRAVMLPTNTSRIVAEKIASSVAALRQS